MNEVFVVPPRHGTTRYWVRSLLGNAISLFSGGAERDDDDEAPAVALRGPAGTVSILLRTGTLRQAEQAKRRFENELKEVGADRFRKKYGIS